MATAVYNLQLTESPGADDDLYLPFEHELDASDSTVPPTPALTYASTVSSMSDLPLLNTPSIDYNNALDAVEAHHAEDSWVTVNSVKERQQLRAEEWARKMEEIAVSKQIVRGRRKVNAALQASTSDPHERLRQILVFLHSPTTSRSTRR